MSEDPKQKDFRFDGACYNQAIDNPRLVPQYRQIFNLMCDGRWRTLPDIETETGFPQASISAQLRHMRKQRFGAHDVEKRSRGDRKHGLYEYRLLVSKG